MLDYTPRNSKIQRISNNEDNNGHGIKDMAHASQPSFTGAGKQMNSIISDHRHTNPLNVSSYPSPLPVPLPRGKPASIYLIPESKISLGIHPLTNLYIREEIMSLNKKMKENQA